MRLRCGSGSGYPVQLLGTGDELGRFEVRVLGELGSVGLVFHLLGDGGPHGLSGGCLHVIGCWPLSIHVARFS